MDRNRRNIIIGAGGVGATAWAAPGVLGVSQAAAATSLPPTTTTTTTTVPCRPVVVFQEDFESPVSAAWFSNGNPIGDRRATTNDNRTVLGQLGVEIVELRLAGLPDCHTQLHIAFDLWIIDTWDGNNQSVGPDRWRFTGPASSFTTSFSNIQLAGYNQAFPDPFPGGNHPYQTGAAEAGQFGFSRNDYAGDARYELAFTEAHVGPTASFLFEGFGLQGLGDESWGLDNVVVTALP